MIAHGCHRLQRISRKAAHHPRLCTSKQTGHSRPVLPASALVHSSNMPSMLRRSSTARTATSTASSAKVTYKTSIFKAIDKCLQKHASNLGRSANTELRDTVTPCQLCSEPQTRLSRPTLIRININEDGNATHQTRMQGRQSSLH